ncbi:sushi, von Willebrand factor type A, EGF and pentraxin domain-containing protein 1-like [Aethina tumida]|uniref:sushi, von Willebrand factor type A, EGF and pentraxin domain-containing protein 1-like n=1 Tax=Aethina tumida TaxID=116153 RepID=UPI00214786F5|nr:sushi, von Willebrand factor type A, EGF and pentraxin domain-containing protein 1-like [Aethina tumida]
MQQSLLLLLFVQAAICDIRFLNGTKDSEFQCPEFYNVDFGIIEYKSEGPTQVAIVTCEEGYDLDGKAQVECIDGMWEDSIRPSCVKRCSPPPYLKNGALEIEGEKDDNGYYHKNALATYTCGEGYTLVPEESKYRVCEKGIWTGSVARCSANSCPRPKDIMNGYYIMENDDPNERNNFYIGQRIHYKCNSGYSLVGYSVLQCLEGGIWSPNGAPHCEIRLKDPANKPPCRDLPAIDHTEVTVENDRTAPWPHGTMIEVSCVGRYRNTIQPCQPSRLQCNEGRWEGILPKCEFARECFPPPKVPYAQIFDILTDNPQEKYPIKSQVSYQCLDSYDLQGTEILTCSIGGCWVPPNGPPEYSPDYKCFPKGDILGKIKTVNAVLWSVVTGAGVVSVLLILCCAILSKRKKPLARTESTSTTVLRTDISDHAILLNNPDRLALIANEDTLPSYDEAVRRASATTLPSGISSVGYRFGRPQWPNLAGRRTRNSPNPDLVTVTRHGSFASHSPSTRSGVDSMGSTDTVAISEGSTNITLDTASSHSGSQPGSCRVHCGSLASFDTSSVVNTEDAPLLEENEFEEVLVHGVQIDNISASDNSSFKSADAP